MIVPPKKPPVGIHFRWDPDLLAQLKKIAEHQGRTVNETGEMLMRWAAEISLHEIEAGETGQKRK